MKDPGRTMVESHYSISVIQAYGGDNSYGYRWTVWLCQLLAGHEQQYYQRVPLDHVQWQYDEQQCQDEHGQPGALRTVMENRENRLSFFVKNKNRETEY
ncbi:MAG: hypothetical protein LUG98_03630 [Tannerellaceae bacterium]|nr:hypothetical protein [Tannerellaceae bacterium]